MSAKYNRASVDHVKNRLRDVIDDLEDAKLKSDERMKQLSQAFEEASLESLPKIY
jgi:hypothetical protein